MVHSDLKNTIDLIKNINKLQLNFNNQNLSFKEYSKNSKYITFTNQSGTDVNVSLDELRNQYKSKYRIDNESSVDTSIFNLNKNLNGGNMSEEFSSTSNNFMSKINNVSNSFVGGNNKEYSETSNSTFLKSKNSELSSTSINSLVGGNNEFSETSNSTFLKSKNSELSATSINSLLGGNKEYSETSNSTFLKSKNSELSATSINSLVGGNNEFSETSNSTFLKSKNSELSATSINSLFGGNNNEFSITSLDEASVFDSESEFNNILKGGKIDDISSTISIPFDKLKLNLSETDSINYRDSSTLNSLSEIKNYNKNNINDYKVLDKLLKQNGGANNSNTNNSNTNKSYTNNFTKSYNINSSSTSSICE